MLSAMLPAFLSAATLAAAALIATPTPARAQTEAPTPKGKAGPDQPARSGTVEVDGINYYYEVRGEGEPLLVLHGGLGSIDMFRPILPELTERRQVIGVDLQGHGRTNLGTRPINLAAIGADLAVVLGYRSVDVLGYSMGGGVALQLAAQHPGKVRRLAMVSAGFARDGFYPEMLKMQAQVGGAMAQAMKDTPMYKSYMAVAPTPGDFPRLLDAMGAWMRTPYDWSADVAKLTMPVMIVFGDSDMYRPEHVVAFYKLLGGGLRDAGWQRETMAKNRLAILPGLTHYDIFLAPELAAAVMPFLNDEKRRTDWSGEAKP
jgi:pimeloyl-ACP methyl ester carboxylesterase